MYGLLLHITIILTSTWIHTTAQLNETNGTSIPISTSPVNTQLYTTSSYPTNSPTTEPTLEPTSPPTTPQNIDSQVQISVTITVTFSNSNVTETDIRQLIIELIKDNTADMNLIIHKINFNITESTTDDSIDIQWDMILIAPDKNHATQVETIIKGNDFKSELEADINELFEDKSIDNGVLNIYADASVIETQDEEKSPGADWLNPNTYGLLNWIIVAAAFCIICICTCFMMRCCYLCCNKTRRMRRSKSGYRVGNPMFGKIESNAENDNAFQSDLRQAIEMNAQKKLLKTTDRDSVGNINIDDVSAAFNMDFDERKPMKKESKSKSKASGNVNKAEKVTSLSDLKDDQDKENDDAASDDEKKELVDKDKDKDKDMIKKKGSEGMVNATAGDTLVPQVTRGGATNDGNTPGGTDEDDPPPAPKPPQNQQNVQEVDDYDLL